MEASKEALSLRIKNSSAADRLRKIIASSSPLASPSAVTQTLPGISDHSGSEPHSNSFVLPGRGFPRMKSTPILQSAPPPRGDGALVSHTGTREGKPVFVNTFGSLPSFHDDSTRSPDAAPHYKPIFESLQQASDMTHNHLRGQLSPLGACAVESHAKTPLEHLQEAKLASPPASSGGPHPVLRLSVVPAGSDVKLGEAVPVTCIGFVNGNPMMLDGRRTVRISSEFGEKLRLICASRPATKADECVYPTAPQTSLSLQQQQQPVASMFDHVGTRSPVLLPPPSYDRPPDEAKQDGRMTCNHHRPASFLNGGFNNTTSNTSPRFTSASACTGTSNVSRDNTTVNHREYHRAIASSKVKRQRLSEDDGGIERSKEFTKNLSSKFNKISRSTFTPKSTLKKLGKKRKAFSNLAAAAAAAHATYNRMPSTKNTEQPARPTQADLRSEPHNGTFSASHEEGKIPCSHSTIHKPVTKQLPIDSQCNGTDTTTTMPPPSTEHVVPEEEQPKRKKKRIHSESDAATQTPDDCDGQLAHSSIQTMSPSSAPPSDACYSDCRRHANASLCPKSYLLVPSYKGFKDYAPIVIGSRTRSTTTQDEKGMLGKSEFPILLIDKTGDEETQIIINQDQIPCSVTTVHGKEIRGQEQTPTTPVAERERRQISFNRNSGETILHKAARLGYVDLAEEQLKANANVDARDNAGWTALHEACSKGQVDVVSLLLRFGADVSVCSKSGIRPLHDAVDGSHMSVLRQLLAYGADPLIATYTGVTALDFAKSETIKTLLRGHANDASFVKNDGSEETSATEDLLWEFRGSSTVMDRHTDDTAEVLCNAPPPQLGTGAEFLVAAKDIPPFYHLPVFEDGKISGYRNYMLLSDALERARMKRDKFLFRHRCTIRQMKRGELRTFASESFLVVPVPEGNGNDTIELIHIGPYAMQSLFGWKFHRF